MTQVYNVRVQFTHKASGLILNLTLYFDNAYSAQKFRENAVNLKDVHNVSEPHPINVYGYTGEALLVLDNEINRED